ncbi:hypothetical protein [Mesorhizobium opportunistum]|uniref:hypothetical protein n=1 Tax=Mesorhizobium opportunistum TaxID=593909 RepID=UPI0004066627|nr:hypothetical protein [Mesorhizobium opportunistum]WJI38616.1 hypothetical protein NL534_33485 [Mesorhizobium opportunistum]
MWEQPATYLETVDDIQIIIGQSRRELQYLIEGPIGAGRFCVVEDKRPMPPVLANYAKRSV